MGFFDGGFGAIVGAAAGLAGNALSGGVSAHSQYKYAKRLMKYQRMQNQEYAQWSAEKLPMMNRTGMENAGFNPLLAINQGTGVQGNVSQSSGISDIHKDFSNLGSTFASALSFYSTMQDLATRRELADSQMEFTKAKIAETSANTAKIIDSTGRANSMWAYLDRVFRPGSDGVSEGEKSLKNLGAGLTHALYNGIVNLNSAVNTYNRYYGEGVKYLQEKWSDFSNK